MSGQFEGLPRGHFRAVLCDPPWRFATWSVRGMDRSADCHYNTMTMDDLAELRIQDIAANDCVLFLWTTWPFLRNALWLIEEWGFSYKTCAFDWTKADTSQIDMFRDDADVQIGMGYWTRSNTEPCLLATRGRPKRLNSDVRQAIIAPRREHSRKPDEIHGRIERLVAGPYIELFARQKRPGWSSWGLETDKFPAMISAK